MAAVLNTSNWFMFKYFANIFMYGASKPASGFYEERKKMMCHKKYVQCKAVFEKTTFFNALKTNFFFRFFFQFLLLDVRKFTKICGPFLIFAYRGDRRTIG